MAIHCDYSLQKLNCAKKSTGKVFVQVSVRGFRKCFIFKY